MDYESVAQDTLKAAAEAGAHEAEVYLQTGCEFDADVRMGEIETLTQAAAKGMGLRVFVDKRMAFGSTTDLSPAALAQLVCGTVDLARSASVDESNGLPDSAFETPPSIELYDPQVTRMAAARKIEMARETEAAAFAHDARINNSRGGGCATHESMRLIANSHGVVYSSRSTDCSISCAPLAQDREDMQTAHYWSACRFLEDLESPHAVGTEAAARAVAKLGARKVETQKATVVFSWSAASVILSAVFAGVIGEDVHRDMSFLKGRLGTRIGPELLTIVDDPLMPRGLGSVPFDGEGVPSSTRTIVDRGILQTYLYDARSARKYGVQPTGNARRSFAGTPSVAPSNFYLQPSELSPRELIAGVRNGFFVTETIGRAANVITGDFSVGASGMWIRNGELAFPVHEVTIAGNLVDMLASIEQVANDAKFITVMVCPTIKLSEMMISGR